MISSRKQIDVLTGLRGIAAYSVLFAHCIDCSFNYQGLNPLHPITPRFAYFGISLFFVLSGFVIYYNYAEKINTRGIIAGGYDFITARIARLFPLYALVMIITLDNLPSKLFHDKLPAEFAYLTLTQSWFNLQAIDFAPAWSVSTEWFFYFAFIFLLPLFNSIKKPTIALILFLTITFLYLPSWIHRQMNFFGNESMWIIYFSPYTRLFDFIAGVLAAKVYLQQPTLQRKTTLLETTMIVAAMAWCVAIIAIDPFLNTRYTPLMFNFIFTPALSVLLILSCRYDSFLSRFLCRRSLQFCGEISYSVYLLGFVMMAALASTFVADKASPMAYVNSSLKLCGIMLSTTFIAYGSYHLFEKPSRLWLRQLFLLKRRSAKSLQPSTSVS